MKITVDGEEVHLSTGGREHRPDRPFVMFLHGAGFNHFTWVLQGRALAYDGYNIIAADMPGHCFSAGSPRRARLERELKDMYLKLVWSNIFHIIKVVKEGRSESDTAANGWKMIALGSDYDGLVDPLNSFPEVASFPELKREMIDYLKSGKEICFAQNGVAQPLPDAEVRELMFGQSAEAILDGILFGNTDHFLGKYFTEAYLGQETGEADEATGQEISVAA